MKLYSHFEEKGYRVEAHMPESDQDLDAWEIRVLIDGELKKTLYAPMSYVPVFGVDVDDVRWISEMADKMMEVLPDASEFDESAAVALDKIEKNFGGQSVRERLAQPDRPKSTHGQFEWTRDAFVNMLTNGFGDREAAEKWMSLARVELGDRTPEEALRLGMGPEVVALLVRLFESGGAGS